MKKTLTREIKELYFYEGGIKKIVDWKNKTTYPENISGNISGLYGNISGLSGDISGLSGNINSGLSGDISGLYGDCTGIKGNVGDCELTVGERKKGVSIEELIK